MALKQEDALVVGLGTAAVVYAIFQAHLPGVAAARASAPGNPHIEAARRTATWEAAAAVAAIGLLSKSPTVFLIGGAAVIFMDFGHRIANVTDNRTGQIAMPGPAATAAPVG